MAKACALTGALSISSCSLLLDWNGYTGGDVLSSSDATDVTSDAPRTRDVVDGTLDVMVGASDAEDARDSGDAAQATDAQEAGPVDTGSPESGKAAPKCSLLNGCLGCCNWAGQCAGGYSAQTCGVNGETCQNCSSTGLVCANETCAPPSQDAGPAPMCVIASCVALHHCIPVWQSACCRDDQTCGCEILIPATGSCL